MGSCLPKQTLLLILLPMLPTFACVRLYLHLVQVRHFCPRDVLAHHRFFGVRRLILSHLPCYRCVSLLPDKRNFSVTRRSRGSCYYC